MQGPGLASTLAHMHAAGTVGSACRGNGRVSTGRPPRHPAVVRASMGSQQAAMGPVRLVDLRNVLDATIDAAVAGLNELAASLPRQSDQDRRADRAEAPTMTSNAPDMILVVTHCRAAPAATITAPVCGPILGRIPDVHTDVRCNGDCRKGLQVCRCVRLHHCETPCCRSLVLYCPCVPLWQRSLHTVRAHMQEAVAPAALARDAAAAAAAARGDGLEQQGQRDGERGARAGRLRPPHRRAARRRRSARIPARGAGRPAGAHQRHPVDSVLRTIGGGLGLRSTYCRALGLSPLPRFT